MNSLHSQIGESDMVPAVPTFPFEEMYSGQLETYNAMKDFKGIVALTSHTGAGKTSVFLALTRNHSTIIIEPRKFLQRQAAIPFGDFVLFGKSEYSCHHAHSAATAPCNTQILCNTTQFHQTCKNKTKTCLEKPCKVFNTEDKVVEYPCEGCKYIKARAEAKRVLVNKGTCIVNFGNFWTLLKYAEIVVIDEADLFFREIAKPTVLRFSTPKHNDPDTISQLLDREVLGIRKAILTSPSSQKYSLQNMLYNALFLSEQSELCFRYQKKDKMYIEISPDKVGVLKGKMFKDKRVILVSATLREFDVPKYEYSVWQRRGIFYAPVGKMTSRELAMKPWLMERAAEQIKKISEVAEGLYDTEKFVIHAGNLGNHGAKLLEALGPELCIIHERGNLMGIIESFKESDKRYLILAGADHGADFTFVKVQFILKFPFASLDERMRILERVMGKQKFGEYYTGEAISRSVQQCGRVCRGWGDFGATIILDSKFVEIYRQNRLKFPMWFQNSFDEISY